MAVNHRQAAALGLRAQTGIRAADPALRHALGRALQLAQRAGVWSSLLLALATTLPMLAHAQAPERAEASSRDALVDRWLNAAVHEQLSRDRFNRYVGAPCALLLGGALLTVPPLASHDLELTPAAVALAMGAGAALVTAAIGGWAQAEATDSQRLASLSGSLGFMALGAAIAVTGLHHASDQPHGFGLRFLAAVGFIEIGLWSSLFMLNALLPERSPTQLQWELRGLPPEQRYERLHDLLAHRDHRRRLTAYLTLPWQVAFGAALVYWAHEAATPGGRAVMYGAGSAVIGLALGALIYEALRAGDAERLAAGEAPST